jgi:hypothetical protein
LHPIRRDCFHAKPVHDPDLQPSEAAMSLYIEAAAGNGQWLIRDYNSGGGLSRMHVRDLRGYIFVNPHGAMARG